MWCLELDTPDEFGPPERIAPDGILEMVFHYRVSMAVRFAQEPFARQARSSVVSQTRRFLEIQPGGPTGLISVRFNPWGADVEPRRLVCTTESVENGTGMKARYTLEISDGYRHNETFELAGPEEELQVYFTNRWSRTPNLGQW